MGKFKVLGGDFRASDSYLDSDTLSLYDPRKKSFLFDFEIPVAQVVSVVHATDDNVKRAGGTVGWAAAGGLLFGPLGILGGALLGGRGKDVTFICTLRDGRKFLATASSEVYKEFLAATFAGVNSSSVPASTTVALDGAGRSALLDALRWTLSTHGFIDITDGLAVLPREVLSQALAWQLDDATPGYRATAGSTDLETDPQFIAFLTREGWLPDPDGFALWYRDWGDQTDETLLEVADALIAALSTAFGLTLIVIDCELY